MNQVKSGNSDLSILYLEDEVLISIDTSTFLRDSGFKEVKTVHRLKSAWDAVDGHHFDIALLDINVDGGQTAIELGQHLRSQNIPVIFASGNGGDGSRLEADGFQFIDKPFSYDALTEQLSRALHQPV